MLDAITTMLEQLACARNPRGRARTLAVVHRAERQPERASCGALHCIETQELLCARVQISVPSGSLPIRYAEVASRSRSSGWSGSFLSAACFAHAGFDSDTCGDGVEHRRVGSSGINNLLQRTLLGVRCDPERQADIVFERWAASKSCVIQLADLAEFLCATTSRYS